MIQQTSLLAYFDRPQNTPENQKIYDDNKERFSNQCRIVCEALLRGERLTTTSALLKYRIGDLRARIRDLRMVMEVKDKLIDGRFKEYFLEDKQ